MKPYLAYIVLALLLFEGCPSLGTDPPPVENRTPRTFFWLYPDSTLREGNSRQRVRWWGEDPDGVVKGYLFAAGKFLTPAKRLPSPDSVAWRWKIKTDSVLAFPLEVRRDTFHIAVRAVDNTFAGTLPENALVRFTPSPFWDTNENGLLDGEDIELPTLWSATDPFGATESMPLRNQPPTIAFAQDPNNPAVTMQQPETTFTAATFSWVPADADGDQTIAGYDIVLNDTTSLDRYYHISNGNTKLITLVVPTGRATSVADVYTGTYQTTVRLQAQQLTGLRIDSLNTFYVRAIDVAGDASPFIAMPDTTVTASRKWFVRRPRSKLLVVGDYIASDRQAARNFYQTVFSQLGTGEYTNFDFLDIGRGLSAQDKRDNRPGSLVPPFVDPALVFTLGLFDVVFWYTDPYPSLNVAQVPLHEYVKDPVHKGRVIYSTMFETATDPRGALREFAPIDSVSGVSLQSDRLYPTLGDTRIPGGYFVYPSDSSAPAALYPVLQLNTIPFHSIFMRTVYKRSNGRYIYHMQQDGREQVRYTSLLTTSNLNALAAQGKNLWACGDDGLVLFSGSGGEAWKTQPTGVQAELHGIHFVNPGTGVIVGELGTILTTQDSGSSWNNRSVVTIESFNGVHFTTAANGFVVGNKGLLIRTIDGGANWSSIQTRTLLPLRGVAFADQTTGVAVGDSGLTFRTSDGGVTWQSISRVTARRLYSVSFATPSNVWAAGAGGILVASTDGGQTWSTKPSPTGFELRSVRFADGSRGIISGVNGIIYTTVDGGASWVKNSTRIEQTQGNGQVLTGSAITDAGKWSVGTGGIILGSLPGSSTWNMLPDGTIKLGVVDGAKRFVFLGLPLHLLNGGGANVKQFLEHVLYEEFKD